MAEEKKGIRYTQEQRAVIMSPDKIVVVNAGPGTGKTETLKKRYGYYFKELGVNPSRILVMSFGTKASQEIASRIREEYPEAEASRISTIHSLGRSLIREIPEFRKSDIHLADDNMIADLAGLNMFSDLSAKKLVALIQEAKDQMLTPDSHLDEFCKKHNSLKSRNPGIFKDAFSRYEKAMEKLHEKGFFDMPDLLLMATKSMEENPEVRKQISSKWDAILVDEVQDLNGLQWRFLECLMGDNKYMTLVGDANQQMYKWRGATSNGMKTFAEKHDAKEFSLTICHRSPQDLLGPANFLMKEDARPLRSSRQEDDIDHRPEFIPCKNAKEYNRTVVNIIKEAQKANINSQDIVFLSRQNDLIKNMTTTLRNANIKTNNMSVSEDVINKFMVLRSWISGERSTEAFIQMFSESATGAENQQIKDIVEDFKASDVCGDIEKEKEWLADRLKKEPEGSLFSLMMDTPVPDNIRDAARLAWKTGNCFLNPKEGPEIKAKKEKEIASILDKLEGKSLAECAEILEDLNIQAKDSYGTQTEKDAVCLSTIHGFKGLECPIVILDMTKGIFPRNGSMITEEEKDILYVALSRAKEKLIIVCDMEKGPSPLLNLIEPSLIKGLEGYTEYKEQVITEIPENGQEFSAELDLDGIMPQSWQDERETLRNYLRDIGIKELLPAEGDPETQFLRNSCPCRGLLETKTGITYPSVENAYLGALSSDLEEKKHISDLSPDTVGFYKVKHPVKASEEEKKNILQELLIRKFSPEYNPEISNKLIKTDRAFIAFEPWDFGSATGVASDSEKNGTGDIIMSLRENLKELKEEEKKRLKGKEGLSTLKVSTTALRSMYLNSQKRKTRI